MAWLRSGARNGLRYSVLGLGAVAAGMLVSSDAAVARHHHRAHYGYRARHRAAAEEYSPPSASILVDGNTGHVLEASNPDALRHPASLTKVMTLYLLFEQLDAGRMKLDTPLRVSEHAADQAPTKLELKAGQTIAVEDAIKGIVTRSANDAAVVIAENLGGSEDSFARLMTQKAHALGMSRTTYVNASGLPDDDQVTTARDQALLARAIQDRFPRYYKYFSTTSFVFRGETIRGHDHLLGSVPGVDGIKTGFIRASGFNLMTSLHRDGRYIVGVVLGGPSAAERDAHMRELISDHFGEASARRSVPLIAERQHSQPEEIAKVRTASRGETSTATANTHIADANAPIRPVVVKTITYRIAPVQTASLTAMPALVPVTTAQPQSASSQPALPQSTASEAVVSQRPSPMPPAEAAQPTIEAQNTLESRTADEAQTAVEAHTMVVASAEPATAEPSAEPAPTETVVPMSRVPEYPTSEPTQAHSRGGWQIQIGAFDDEDEARQHLSEVQFKLHTLLAMADPFTERVQKGDKALYRARFAGLNKEAADNACKQLKHDDIQCMAHKD